MNEPTKNGCWNCRYREKLLCKVNPKLSETRLETCLRSSKRDLDEGQFKIPFSYEEAQEFRDYDIEDTLIGEKCILWKPRTHFIFIFR